MKNILVSVSLLAFLQVSVKAQVKTNVAYQIYEIEGNKMPASAVIIFTDDNKVSGKGACNKFFGTYAQNNSELNIKAVGSTKMLCDAASNKIEKQLFDVLAKITVAEIKGSVVNLKNGSKKLLVLTPQKNYEQTPVAVKKEKEPAKIQATVDPYASNKRNELYDPNHLEAIKGMFFKCVAVNGSEFQPEYTEGLQLIFTDLKKSSSMVITNCQKKDVIFFSDQKHTLQFKDGSTAGKETPDCALDNQIEGALELLWNTNTFTYDFEGLHLFDHTGKETLRFMPRTN